jgi:hypothetical protein
MAHRQQELIDRLLGEETTERDHSLQKQALDRALEKTVPKTLTPWEWEQYYRDNGVPESHKRSASQRPTPKKRQAWWRRLFGAGGSSSAR